MATKKKTKGSTGTLQAGTVVPESDFRERPENIRDTLAKLREDLCCALEVGVAYRFEESAVLTANGFYSLTVRAVPVDG